MVSSSTTETSYAVEVRYWVMNVAHIRLISSRLRSRGVIFTRSACCSRPVPGNRLRMSSASSTGWSLRNCIARPRIRWSLVSGVASPYVVTMYVRLIARGGCAASPCTLA